MKDILINFRSKIREMEIDACIDRILENNRIHDPKDGTFRKGKAQAGDVISLSKPAAQRAGMDPKYAERSIATGESRSGILEGYNQGGNQRRDTKGTEE